MHDELLCIASCTTFVIDAFFLWLCPPSDARADLEFLKSLFELVKKLMQQSSKKNNLLRTFADSSKCTSMPKIQFELCLSEISFDCKPCLLQKVNLFSLLKVCKQSLLCFCPTFEMTQNVILGTAWNWKSMSPRLSPYILSFFNS